MNQNNNQKPDFTGLGITPAMLTRLQDLKFIHPTPIQLKSIPVATSGQDVVGIAQTGSGKTLAFSIPLVQSLIASKQVGLILLPTRELAIQVEETLNKLVKPFNLRTALIIGGVNANPQAKQLKRQPDIIIATPGRLIDHMEQRNVNLSKVGVLILDEADRMLDMGFAPQLKKILAVVPKQRQTLLFSATMPDQIADITHQYMRSPLRVEVAPPGTTAEKIDQEVIMVEKKDKMGLLKKLLNEHKGSVLVFTRTKFGAKRIAKDLKMGGYTVEELHSNRSQNQRQTALKGFASGYYRILVATDIAARGIDVKHLELVINFDLPTQAEDYTHRIGRTGRAGRSGKAISFAEYDEKHDIALIQELINITLPIKAATGEKMEALKGSRNYPKKKGPSQRGNRNQSKKQSRSKNSKNQAHSNPKRSGSKPKSRNRNSSKRRTS